MTNREKSVLLARAMGWNYLDAHHVQDAAHDWVVFRGRFNLYKPAQMALAWRVLNWAMDEESSFALFQGQKFFRWWNDISISGASNRNLLVQPPADAQRLWLDKILELVAIEAVIVETADED